uniref:Uncharacterized protein n=1 Tax=Oryza meridionalis TaxID=40149 RepID=A0A0E0E971_9ORYZ
MARGPSDSSILASPPVESVARMEAPPLPSSPVPLRLDGVSRPPPLPSSPLPLHESLAQCHEKGRESVSLPVHMKWNISMPVDLRWDSLTNDGMFINTRGWMVRRPHVELDAVDWTGGSPAAMRWTGGSPAARKTESVACSGLGSQVVLSAEEEVHVDHAHPAQDGPRLPVPHGDGRVLTPATTAFDLRVGVGDGGGRRKPPHEWFAAAPSTSSTARLTSIEWSSGGGGVHAREREGVSEVAPGRDGVNDEWMENTTDWHVA